VNLPDAQWSDALPKLLQVKILHSIEDAGRFSGVSRPLEGLATDFQLVPAEAANAPAAVAALDRAFGQAGSDLVTWVGHAVNEPTLPKATLPRRTSGG
jgi:ABC-type uncharacterized transport system auxiliary subunit